MGAWGSGNLENDAAQDLLADFCDKHFDLIVTTLQNGHGHEFDDLDHYEVMLSVEILLILGERGMVNSSPDPDTLRSLIPPLIQRWEDYHRKAGHEPPPARRQVIAESFERLVALAKTACRGSLDHRLDLIREKWQSQRKSE